MRILQFGRFDFSENKGGVQYYAESLAQHLRNRIELDQVVSSTGPKTKVEQLGASTKVIVASYGELQSVPASPGIFTWAWKLFKERKYDLIHLNFPDPLAMLATFFLPKSVPIVVTWHSDIIRQKWALRIYTPVLKLFMKRVSKIVVSTPLHYSSCEQLRDLNMADKIVVIPFGVEEKDWELTDKVRQEAEQIRSQFPNRFLLFAFGRHVYYKGFEYLLGALAQLPGCHLILGGSGPLTEELKATSIRANIEDRVTFTGIIPGEKLPAYLYACDLFCFPSIDTTEAFGYAQVEAMMCGKPVLSCNLNNGVNFVSRHNETGFVVEPKNSDLLALAIKDLQKNPELLQRLSSQAQVRSQKEFIASLTAERTLRLFQDVIDQAKTRF